MSARCWEDKSEYYCNLYGAWSDEHVSAFLNNATCMLPDGHKRPHEWVPDGDIGVSFSESEPTKVSS